MIESIRKIDLMYWFFGKACGVHICKDCSNFVQGQYHNKTLRKCKVYGLTHSQATDWAQRYEACGMFNKEWNGNNVVDYVRRGGVRPKMDSKLDGQTTFEDGANNDR